MGNEADKKFTWVIKNFSFFPSYRRESVYSDIFVVGRCKWRLLASFGGYDNDYLSLYLVVPNLESLPSGWRRHAKFSFTIVNQVPGEFSQLRESLYWFDQKDHTRGFDSMILLNKEFLVNNVLKIVAEVDVLDVVGELVLPVETIVNVNGFQVLASQVEAVNSLFEKHPNVASDVRAENPHLGTTYLNTLLNLTDILCYSPVELSISDLADAYSSLRYVAKAGFKLGWLEKALKEAGGTRIREIEKESSYLTHKRVDMNALLEFLY